MITSRTGPPRWIVPLLVALALLAHGTPAATQAFTPPAEPPADWGPVSFNLESVPYPHPVRFLELEVLGEPVRMAYMDVAPSAPANGRTVVLLHGMNFYGEYWAGTIEALRREGFRVVVPDQIGFGRSSKPIIHYTVHLMALNTKRLLDHLGIARAAVVGHSMGGMAATRFAFSYPESTTHLAMVNQIGLTDARLTRPWRDTEEVYRSTLSNTSYQSLLQNHDRYYPQWKPEYLKYVRIQYGWTLSGDWPRMARIRALLSQMVYEDPVVYDWPHIRARALVIGGEQDRLVEDYPGLARNVARTIPGAELILYPGVGHSPHLEIPERFHADLVRFLKSPPVAGAATGD